MILIIVLTSLLLILGCYEKYRHQINLKSIPLRINVNGIRGKSTVTRLMTGILIAAGYRVVAKTTGTEARIIYWNTNEETPIERRPEGANISEQIKVVAAAARMNANALVSECMAITPDYQIIFQNELLKANIGVIVNVIEDHLEVMGPTLDNIAEALTATIPYDGKLIIAQGPYEEYFRKIAKERNTEVIVAKTSEISKEQMKQFKSIYFPENIALALSLAKALNIDDETAWNGMLMANSDPGIAEVHTLKILEKTTYFVNGFAANDPNSTFAIWEKIKELGYPTDCPVILMNCRDDRIDRSIQFAQDFLPNIPMDLLVAMGKETKPIIRAYHSSQIVAKEFFDASGNNGSQVYKDIEEKLAGKMIFGIGNIHGTADEFINALMNSSTLNYKGRENYIGEKQC